MKLNDLLTLTREIERLLAVEEQAKKVVEAYNKGFLLDKPNYSCQGGLQVSILQDRLEGQFGDERDNE